MLIVNHCLSYIDENKQNSVESGHHVYISLVMQLLLGNGAVARLSLGNKCEQKDMTR